MENELIDKWGEWIDVSDLAIGDSDMYVTFTGTNARFLKNVTKNPLYGKKVNLTELYYKMMDDVIEYIQSDEFLNYKEQITVKVCKFTAKKYGISIAWVYNRLFNNNKTVVSFLKTDQLFQMMIDRVGSVEKIDWIRIFNRTAQFITNNESILTYVANKILKGDIYKHFVNRYNLRVDGIKFTNGNDTYNGKNVVRRMIVLKWEIGGLNKEKEINLGSLAQDKRDWWRSMTNRSNKNRYKIVDYDKLLNKRDENEVLPYRCPIDNNIILNYTGIDFSGGNHNMYECKNNTGLNETWSMSSIDRIDSKREYDYDNIQIISQYYNSLKNCGSFEQIDKLYNYYQFKIKNELYPIEYMI